MGLVVTVISARAPRARAWVRELVDAFEENDLLTYASAISFQILSSLVPALMFGFGLLGFLSLESVWRDELAPDFKGSVSKPAFAVIDDAVTKALTQHQLFWVSFGFLIALWQVSGGVRAVMGALNTVHGVQTQRSFVRRMLISFGLALALGACWLVAIVAVVLGPLLYGDGSFVVAALLFLVRWTVAGAVLLLAVALVLHYAPEPDQPLDGVSFGSLLIMFGWVAMSAGFGFYLREIADYNSIFGSLATIVVLIAYLYAAAVVFLGGVQIDAMVRSRA
jgi:membrane protein